MFRFVRSAVLASLLTPVVAQAWTGNDLVRWEADYSRSTPGWDGGMYLGYIAGIAEFGNTILYCAPEGVTNGQNAAVVTKFLKNNPERWTENSGRLVIAALQASYPPCKTKN